MRAVKAVKRQYQARGLKVHHFARREIVIAANESLREHHELITEAAVVVEQWRKEGFFGKRAMRCAPLNTNAQTTKAWSATAFVVRMSWSKWEIEMIVGYARVSTDGQTLDAQHATLTAAGAQRVFAEKVSGAVTDRKAGKGDRCPGHRGCPPCHSSWSLGPLNSRSAQRVGQRSEGRRGVSVVGRYLGRHDNPTRPVDADGTGRVGGVWEGADQGQDRWRP